MKIFGIKKNKAGSDVLLGHGWAAYVEVGENFNEEELTSEIGTTANQNSLNRSFSLLARKTKANIWFRFQVNKFSRSHFDLGSSNSRYFEVQYRYEPRARYLMKNKWAAVPCGIYVIEYTISQGNAYSHFSVNKGLTYSIFMESKLTKNFEQNIMLICDLFTTTEEQLHNTIINRTAPYF
jgi:hypothetical protein